MHKPRDRALWTQKLTILQNKDVILMPRNEPGSGGLGIISEVTSRIPVSVGRKLWREWDDKSGNSENQLNF